jgi:hypothetical protein
VLNEGDFLGWCRRLALAETTQSAIAEVRSRNPTRRVGGGRDNVSGRYPSRKMGLTIQFESHRVELPLVYQMEHDPGILRPTALDSARLSRGQRTTRFGHAHTGLLRNPPRLCGLGGMQILRGSSKTGHQDSKPLPSRWQRQMALPAGRSAQLAAGLGLSGMVVSGDQLESPTKSHVPGRLPTM